MTRRVPGEPGVWLIVIGDIVAFAIAFGVLLYYRGNQSAVFAASQSDLAIGFALANTAVLLTSSVAVVAGVEAIRAARMEQARRALAAAIALGATFAVLKVVEWIVEVHAGHKPATNDFFALYYAVTGLHLLHVLIGTLGLSLVRRAARAPQITGRNLEMVESAGIFWHMVDLIWLVLLPVVYLVH